MKIRQNNALGELGTAIGIGLLGGLAGTAAITLSQTIEMKITKRGPSEAPIKVVKQTAGVAPATEEDKQKVSHEIHWTYGTSWGIARGLIGLTGLRGVAATVVHFASIWTTALIMLPAFKASPPVSEQKPKAIAIDALHHAVYATAAGLVYEILDAGSRNQRRFERLLEKVGHWKNLKEKFAA